MNRLKMIKRQHGWPGGIHPVEGPRGEQGVIEEFKNRQARWGLSHQKCGRAVKLVLPHFR